MSSKRATCIYCGEPRGLTGGLRYHLACEPTTCTCDEPTPNGLGECQSCFRLVLSHSWHAGIPSRPSSPASEGVASASVPSVACGSGATPPVGPVPTTGGTAA